ncbi:MAG TPA: 50S ribosomal protein L32 [Polyangiaceae bacterium]|nr:50S ribosomal protein L32 [Polyangiaceae bacterium]
MAVPKRRTSASKRDMRRAANEKIVAPNVIACPNCNEPTLSHRVCPNCGHYKRREVIVMKADEAEE